MQSYTQSFFTSPVSVSDITKRVRDLAYRTSSAIQTIRKSDPAQAEMVEILIQGIWNRTSRSSENTGITDETPSSDVPDGDGDITLEDLGAVSSAESSASAANRRIEHDIETEATRFAVEIETREILFYLRTVKSASIEDIMLQLYRRGYPQKRKTATDALNSLLVVTPSLNASKIKAAPTGKFSLTDEQRRHMDDQLAAHTPA